MQINDCIVAALGPEGQINDLLFAYFGGTSEENLQDAEYRWLLAKGATPANINDMWFELLRAAGYLGSLNDMLHDYWCGGGPVPPLPTYVLTLATDGTGTGVINSVPDKIEYLEGQAVELTAVPDVGSVFVTWAGDLTGTDNPQWVFMYGPRSVTATFNLSP